MWSDNLWTDTCRKILVMTMTFHLYVLRVIKLFETDIIFFCCLFFIILNVLYKLFYTAFNTVHLQWIKNIPISKRAVYTPSRRYTCVNLFYIWCFTFMLSLHSIALLCILLFKWVKDPSRVCL